MFPALAAFLLAVTGCTSATETDTTTDPKPVAARTAPGPSSASGARPLGAAIRDLETAPEYTGTYDRDAFKHWNRGLNPDDGCDTREELLLAEAVKAPTKGAGCKLSGGSWFSYYDGATVTDAGALDVDHMVPLEEAWSSGARSWTPERREAYANDLTAERSLVAVTAKTNRSKGKRDPAEWLPPADSALCTYLVDWTTTKLRWGLTADAAERDALIQHAKRCPDATVEVQPAP
ncbi:HNH endonuclease [Streptomyces sp. SID11385]|nr:HNH endonuclease family protein [Streptomyces sp. SID11385]NEA39295.1 HNH endonuclease [Streptomyces sp. SID11385]